MKALRWSLGILAAVVILLVLTIVLATELINPNDYRGELERLVQRHTGRPLVIEGDLHLSWYPWLKLHIGAARLGNRPGANGPDLIDWRSASIGVRLLPLLLHRRLQFDTLRVRGADIHLWRDARGVGNWQHLLASTASTGGASPSAVAIGGVVLRDSTLVVRESGKTIRLTHWQMHVGPWTSGQALSVRTRFVLHAPQVPAGGVPVTFSAHDLSVHTAPLAVTVPQWHLRLSSAALSGSVRFADAHSHPRASGQLWLKVPSVRALVTAWGVKMRLPRDPHVLGALSVSGHWRLRGRNLRVDPLEARLDATTLTGWAARAGGLRSRWTFALKANRIDFSDYLPPTRKHPKSLQLPLASLHALRAAGSLTVQRAVIGGTTMRDVRLQVQ